MAASKKTRGRTIMDMLQSQPQSQHPPESQPPTQSRTRSQANMQDPPPSQHPPQSKPPIQSRTRSQANVQVPAPSQPPPQSQPPIQANTRSQAHVQAPPPSQPPPQLPSSHPLTRSRAHAEPQPQIQTQPQASSQPSHVEGTQSTQITGPSGSEATSTRRGRGIAKGLDTWGTGQKLHLEFNELMQPECDNESHLATHLGIIARNGEQVPLIYAQWTDVPNDVKDYVWKEVQDNTDAPPEYRSNCLKSVGYLWRRWKSYVKTNYYDIWDTD